MGKLVLKSDTEKKPTNMSHNISSDAAASLDLDKAIDT